MSVCECKHLSAFFFVSDYFPDFSASFDFSKKNCQINLRKNRMSITFPNLLFVVTRYFSYCLPRSLLCQLSIEAAPADMFSFFGL